MDSRKLARCLIAVFLCASALFAQSGGTITGTVYDLDGMVVANAPVQATNKMTNGILKTTTSEKGAYTLAQLPAGTYDLSVAAIGFNAYVQQNVTVGASQNLHVDVRLVDYQFGTLGDGREFRIDLLSAHPTPSGPTPR